MCAVPGCSRCAPRSNQTHVGDSAPGSVVRASVQVTFTQHKDLEDYTNQNPKSGGGNIERVWRVIAGDRLDTIAYQVYGDATKWRMIASYNGIVNPLKLQPGQQLIIPET